MDMFKEIKDFNFKETFEEMIKVNFDEKMMPDKY